MIRAPPWTLRQQMRLLLVAEVARACNLRHTAPYDTLAPRAVRSNQNTQNKTEQNKTKSKNKRNKNKRKKTNTRPTPRQSITHYHQLPERGPTCGCAYPAAHSFSFPSDTSFSHSWAFMLLHWSFPCVPMVSFQLQAHFWRPVANSSLQVWQAPGHSAVGRFVAFLGHQLHIRIRSGSKPAPLSAKSQTTVVQHHPNQGLSPLAGGPDDMKYILRRLDKNC